MGPEGTRQTGGLRGVITVPPTGKGFQGGAKPWGRAALGAGPPYQPGMVPGRRRSDRHPPLRQAREPPFTLVCSQHSLLLSPPAQVRAVQVELPCNETQSPHSAFAKHLDFFF